MIWVLLYILAAAVSPALSCGEEVVVGSGETYTIQTPNYPAKYPARVTCDWTITSATGEGLILSCPSIEIPSSLFCILGEITVSAGSDELSFCDKKSFNVYINKNSFDFQFSSSLWFGNRGYTGFSCTVSVNSESVDEPTTKPPTTEAPEEKCECGAKGNSRIVGGETAELHEYPWQVMLRTARGSHYCGGTLISKNYVLTASHCVDDDTTDSMFVSLGDHQKYTGSETDKTIHMRVSEIIMHKDYDSDTTDNDIALLRLDQPVEFNDAIRPACLPYDIDSSQLSGKTSTVTGWGTTTQGGTTSGTLLEVDLPLLTTTECKKYYPNEITDNMICTYKPGKDSCQGDSGGPLVLNQNDKHYLVGVVSWGYGCARRNNPGAYAKVTNYLDWIEEKTGENFCKM